MRMGNEGQVQEGGYLYFKNITLIVMRSARLEGCFFQSVCHNHEECPCHFSASFQIWLTLQVPTQISSFYEVFLTYSSMCVIPLSFELLIYKLCSVVLDYIIIVNLILFSVCVHVCGCTAPLVSLSNVQSPRRLAQSCVQCNPIDT